MNKIKTGDDLIGVLQKKENTGDHAPVSSCFGPDLATNAVIRVFCTGCGNTTDVHEAGAKSLIEKLPAKLDRHFIQVKACMQCDEFFIDGEIKAIDSI